MHAAIFLTEIGFVMFSFFNIVDLHGTVRFRGEKKTALIVVAERSNMRFYGWCFASGRVAPK